MGDVRDHYQISFKNYDFADFGVVVTTRDD